MSDEQLAFQMEYLNRIADSLSEDPNTAGIYSCPPSSTVIRIVLPPKVDIDLTGEEAKEVTLGSFELAL